MTERHYGQWRIAAVRNTRTVGWAREPRKGPWSGYVTLPLVGVLALGLFAFSAVLFPPAAPEQDTIAVDTPEESANPATPPTTAEPQERTADADVSPPQEDAAPLPEDHRAQADENHEPQADPPRTITAVVHFSHNGTELTYEGIVELQRFAEEAAAADASWVRIDGYGDDTGTPEANLQVSLQRSEEAAAFLQEMMPVDGVAFITAGHGAANPIADNSTVEGRARNRRIEAVAGTDADFARLFDAGSTPAMRMTEPDSDPEHEPAAEQSPLHPGP
ncbi:MAG: OmpA family protein [Thermobifida fusca]|uniref:OmpA family protein n=1 Tax=Thermobifida TaxID=83677 RepID=UPI00187C44E3|nr:MULTISPECIES: OmpA family protein [Thermobifida]